MKRDFSYIVLLAIAQKVLGYLKDVWITSKYGVSLETDGYYIAMSFPFLLLAVVGMDAAKGVVTPLLSESQIKGTEELQHRARKQLYLFIVCASVLMLVGYVFAAQFVDVLFMGYASNEKEQVVPAFRISLLLILPIGVYSFLVSYLGVLKKFFLQNIGELLITLAVIFGFFVLLGDKHIYTIVYYNVFAYYAIVFVLIALLFHREFKLPNKKELWEEFRIIAKLVFPLLLLVGAGELAKTTDRTIASHYEKGMMTAVNLSWNMSNIIIAVIAYSYMKIWFPRFSNYYQKSEKEQLKKGFNQCLSVLLSFFIPLSIFCFLFSEAIIGTAYYRGTFGAQALEWTSNCFRYYSLMFVPNMLYLVPTFLFLSAEKNKVLGKMGVFSFGGNIIASVGLSYYLGYIGIPLGTLVSLCLYSLLLLVSLKKHFQILVSNKTTKYCIAVFVWSSVLAIVLKNYLHPLLEYPYILQLSVLGGVFFSLSGVGVLLFSKKMKINLV